MVHEGKLLVHIASNGRSFELLCDETMLVEAVMRRIASETGISVSDQIVLCMEMKLEPQRSLSVYKLPSDDKEVFLFSKARLQLNSPPPPPEQVNVSDSLEPSPSWDDDRHPLDDASDPALKILPSYEREFRCHYQKGLVIHNSSMVKYGHCERLLREQMVQVRALEIARGNFDQFYRLVNQNYGDFMKRYMQQHRMHCDLLGNFRRDVEKLKSIKLHPSLQTSTVKCLLDFVKEENLRKSVENCKSSHKQFENKVSQFKQAFGELKGRVEELLQDRALIPVKNLEQAIKEHLRYITEQKSIMQSLRLVFVYLFNSLNFMHALFVKENKCSDTCVPAVFRGKSIHSLIVWIFF